MQTGGLGSLPLWIASLGAVGAAGLYLVELFLTTLSWMDSPISFGPGGWEEWRQTIVYITTSPEFLLMTAVLAAGIVALVRRKNAMQVRYTQLTLAQFTATFAMLLLYALIAAPTLTAYSICCWLGPW